MRILRFCAFALLLICLILAAALFLVIRNENRIAQFALARIYERTGLEITITGAKIGFGTHLAVILENPRVAMKGASLGTFQAIRATLSYVAIFRRNGLPLARLELDQPRVRLPAAAAEISTAGIPHLDAEAAETLNRALNALSDTVQRVDVIDGQLSTRENLMLIDQFDLRARRQHYHRVGDWPWILDFNGALEQPPVHDVKLAGHLRLGARPQRPESILAGRLWFWGFDLHRLKLGSAIASAALDGDLRLSMDTAGSITGDSHTNLRGVTVSLKNGEAALPSADYQLSSSYRLSAAQIDITQLTLQRGTTHLLSGAAAIINPYDADRGANLSVSGARLELSRLLRLLRSVPGLPPAVAERTNNVTGGNLILGGISLQTSIPIRDWTFVTLRDHLRADLTINDAAVQFPAGLQLPPLQKFDVQLHYDSGALKLTQGSLQVGTSRLSNLIANLDLHNAPNRISYQTGGAGDLDLTQLAPAIRNALHQAISSTGNLTALAGHLSFSIAARDMITGLHWKPPRNYLISALPNRVSVGIKGVSPAILLTEGKFTLTPDAVTVARVRVLPDGASGGNVFLDGRIEPRPGLARLKNFTAELHQIQIERWLPLLTDPDAVSADGRLGGLLTANGELSRRKTPSVKGKLTLAAGHLSFGFLRAPIKVRAATLMLDGKGLLLKMPGSSLENQPLDFQMAVPDFSRPAVRIDAHAAKLDLFVLRFIRVPWMPPTAPHFFAVPVSGHLQADQAVFDKLLMSNVATDFSRDQVNWRVYDFTGHAFAGALRLNIDGKTGPDNWIRMTGSVSNMDTALLLVTSDPASRPTLIGSLSMTYDLWANTDTDFFNTLAGSFSLQIKDGVLQRFALLSKILSFIDLKNWITAQFPDPRISGIPFKIITADFKGANGDFYTNNLLLTGPVMDISARGDIHFGQGRINMDVGMVPFSTVNWIVSHIPLVGTNLAGGSRGLVGAYFHVVGPYKDPTVRPKPITSVTEFVKRTLGLPVNIIVPHTIK